MVKIENLTFWYNKKSILFDKLNMNLMSGKIYGLFGLNGAGKTTLLKHIAGLLFPKSGECKVFDMHSSDRKPGILADIFIIPEEFSLPNITAESYVAINAPFFPKFDYKEFESYINEFQISFGKKINTMSYGQRKKLLIAFSLACNTSLLLMDEPTNGLDIPSKSQFRKIIAASGNESRCLLISTHQVRDLGSIIDQVTILDNGKIIFDKNIDAISQKLAFGMLKEGSKEEVIFAEDNLMGSAAVYHNKGTDSNIDLELLFNAVINDAEKVNNAF